MPVLRLRHTTTLVQALADRAAAAAVLLWAACVLTAPAKASERVYTIGNYPVEASAQNAVSAKRAAIDDGRKAAFRSLLKRLVPVTAYNRLKPVKTIDPRPLVASMAVKSEQSSGTRYIASLDFSFSAPAVQKALKAHGIPFVDRAAETTILVAIYSPPQSGGGSVPADMAASQGSTLWRSVWTDLDLANSVAPLKVRQRVKNLQAETIRKVAGGDFSEMRILAAEYGVDRVVLAVAEPDLAAKRLNVVVAGRDAVGTFSLKRRYRIDDEDFAYTLEFAAVISQGVIEGRWKAVNGPRSTGVAATGGAASEVEIWVEFTNLAQWRGRQQLLETMPGVEDLRTGGLSAQGASVQLRYPGGGESLRDALAQQGISLTPYNGTWILR